MSPEFDSLSHESDFLNQLTQQEKGKENHQSKTNFAKILT